MNMTKINITDIIIRYEEGIVGYGVDLRLLGFVVEMDERHTS